VPPVHRWPLTPARDRERTRCSVRHRSPAVRSEAWEVPAASSATRARNPGRSSDPGKSWPATPTTKPETNCWPARNCQGHSPEHRLPQGLPVVRRRDRRAGHHRRDRRADLRRRAGLGWKEILARADYRRMGSSGCRSSQGRQASLSGSQERANRAATDQKRLRAPSPQGLRYRTEKKAPVRGVHRGRLLGTVRHGGRYSRARSLGRYAGRRWCHRVRFEDWVYPLRLFRHPWRASCRSIR
jgi:hypothetical protein